MTARQNPDGISVDTVIVAIVITMPRCISLAHAALLLSVIIAPRTRC